MAPTAHAAAPPAPRAAGLLARRAAGVLAVCAAGLLAGCQAAPVDPALPAAVDLHPLQACGLAASADQVLAQINALRAQGAVCGRRGAMAGAPPLAWDARLQRASDAHAAEMAAADRIDHLGPGGRTMGERARDTGYAWARLAENLAAGQTQLSEVLQAWLASEGHCANLMNPLLRHAALACAPGAGAGAAQPTYWALKLGAPR